MRLRPITTDDFAAVLDLHQRSEAHDRIPRILVMSELQHMLNNSRTVLDTDTVLVEVDDRIVGYLWTLHLPSEIRLERCYITGLVDPDYRRSGVGSAMVKWGMARAEEQLRSSGNALPKYIRADHYDFVDGVAQLFRSFGLKPIRYYNEMRRPSQPVPDVAPLPDDLRLIPWPNERDNEIREVKNAAFADHWGSTPTAPEQWAEGMEEETVRTDLSFVVETVAGEVVALCLNERFPADDQLSDRKEGWISLIGTLPEYRGLGIASALIGETLRAFSAEGLTHACLGVDSDSLTGAQTLYQSLGFESFSRSTTYELLLDESNAQEADTR